MKIKGQPNTVKVGFRRVELADKQNEFVYKELKLNELKNDIIVNHRTLTKFDEEEGTIRV